VSARGDSRGGGSVSKTRFALLTMLLTACQAEFTPLPPPLHVTVDDDIPDDEMTLIQQAAANWNQAVPGSIVAVSRVHHTGCGVVTIHRISESQQSEYKASGLTFSNDDCQADIFIRAPYDETDRPIYVVTVTHEIGHVFLGDNSAHSDVPTDIMFNSKDGETRLNQRVSASEASRVAARL
jgi:hypothetical protein